MPRACSSFVRKTMDAAESENLGQEAHQRQGRPRLYHTKSKTGCNRCRARRVKVLGHNRSLLFFPVTTANSAASVTKRILSA